MQYWGTPKQKKTNFQFWGTSLSLLRGGGGGGQGNRYPHPMGGLHILNN